MTQTWPVPFLGTTQVNAILKTQANQAFETLRSNFLGSAEPSAMTPGQIWVDTGSTPALVKMRNAGDTGWIVLGVFSGDNAIQWNAQGWSSLSASATGEVGIASRACTVQRLILSASVASTSSSGNEWQFQLKNYPNSAPGSPVNLFSATVGTHTVDEDIGGGEFVAKQAYVLVPDQNATLADLDRLELVVTKVGSATALTDFRARVQVV